LPLPGLKTSHRNSILDGELVNETKRGKSELLFLFFDALVVDEKLLIDREYTTRLGVFLID
jgi:ATP-dependent DNA ligase